MDDRLLPLLECPRDHTDLRLQDGDLYCASGHRYPVVGGVPIFLLAEKDQTIGVARASLEAPERTADAPLYVETLGISDELKRRVEKAWIAGGKIDPAVAHLIGATSGLGYVHRIGRLSAYPIPEISVGDGNGELLLDVGSSWGRWAVSAARKGWRVVAIDPSLGALLAAQRAFPEFSSNIYRVCGDARFLPFKPGIFCCAFSYSVIQHFSESDAELAIAELGRVLHRGGFAKIQMAHRGGLRSTYSRTRRNYQNSGPFRVRYWSLAAMRDAFEKNVGPAHLAPEAFGGLGLLSEDRNLVSPAARAATAISELLKRLSVALPALIKFADSVYVIATKR